MMDAESAARLRELDKRMVQLERITGNLPVRIPTGGAGGAFTIGTTVAALGAAADNTLAYCTTDKCLAVYEHTTGWRALTCYKGTSRPTSRIYVGDEWTDPATGKRQHYTGSVWIYVTHIS